MNKLTRSAQLIKQNKRQRQASPDSVRASQDDNQTTVCGRCGFKPKFLRRTANCPQCEAIANWTHERWYKRRAKVASKIAEAETECSWPL